MPDSALKLDLTPQMHEPTMLVGFSGWMDGGDVSTGTIEWLIDQLGAIEIGRIAPDDFYIYNFPGTMEVASLFRPHGRIVDGLVMDFEEPAPIIHADPQRNLVFIEGREPNMHWRSFADCIFTAAEKLGVERIFFVGSVGGLVTHTRVPRIGCSVSDRSLRKAMEPFGLRFTSYEGPVSLVTMMMQAAKKRRIEMITLVAEIPAYIEGRNPKSIAAVLRQVSAILGINLDLETLRSESDEWEKRVSEAVEEQPELAEQVRKLEAEYDEEVFDTQMGDLKELLERRGVRLD